MGLSSRQARRRAERRKRFWFAVFRLSILLAIIGAAAYNAYQFGLALNRDEIRDLRARLDDAVARNEGHAAEVGKLTEALAAARFEAAEYRERYARLVPSKEMRDLVDLVRARLEEGLAAQRLALYIREARPPADCRPAEIKRFLVKTPLYDGANTWVRFEDLVTVSATGETTLAASGQPNAWFDPDKPVSVTFRAIGGGRASEVTGKLPLHHTMTVKDREFRFSISTGARGFVEVAGDSCSFGVGSETGSLAETNS